MGPCLDKAIEDLGAAIVELCLAPSEPGLRARRRRELFLLLANQGRPLALAVSEAEAALVELEKLEEADRKAGR